MSLKYVGSGHYCYANATTMALSKLGYDYEVGYIECLMTVGISAFWTGGNPSVPFFSSAFGDPDSGITATLTNLGFSFERYYCKEIIDTTKSDSLKKLKNMLHHGPVIIGPVDMGKLKHNPNFNDLHGVDHFITVYNMDDKNVYFHDPAGFPYVNMDIDSFFDTWTAENIFYKDGSCSMWGKLKKDYTPSPKEVYEETNNRIQEIILKEKNSSISLKLGSKAIRKLSKEFDNGIIPEYLINHLKFYSFQLGARRCSDFYDFYKEYDEGIAEIMLEKAKTFGAAQVALQHNDGKKVYELVMMLAELEDEFQVLLIDDE